MPEELSQKKSIQKYFSISFVLTLVSQASFILYYGRFGIQPLQFFEPTEIIVNSVKDFMVISVLFYLFILILTVLTVSSHLRKKPIHVGLDNKEIQLFQKLELKKKRHIKQMSQLELLRIAMYSSARSRSVANITIYLLSAIAAAIVFAFLGDKRQMEIITTALAIVIFACLLLYAVLYANYLHDKFEKLIEFPPTIKQVLNAVSPLVLASIFMYALITAILTDVKVYYAYRDNKYIGSRFITKTDTIKIDTSNLLIGRSKEWLFMFRPKDKSLRIVRRLEISEEIIKNRKKTFAAMLFQNY